MTLSKCQRVSLACQTNAQTMAADKTYAALSGHSKCLCNYLINNNPYFRISSFFSSSASHAAHAGQSQYFAPLDLISLAWIRMFFAPSSPKTLAPISDSAKAIRPSIAADSIEIILCSFFDFGTCGWCCEQVFC